MGNRPQNKPEQESRDLLFSVSNKHAASSGTAPLIDGDVRDRYCGYFQNEYGEQALFIYHYPTKMATVWLGDAGWDKPYNVVDGDAPDLILNEPEKMWLRACWQAATAHQEK
jgi:hypothetical protein